MRLLLWTAAGLLMTVLVTSMPAGAHHASAPFYDPEKQVEAVGTVTQFVFRNPHSFVYLDAPNTDGDVVGWEVEMGTAVMMTRRGWTSDTIKAGDEIRGNRHARQARMGSAAPN